MTESKRELKLSQSKSRNTPFRGHNQSPPPCICGQKHWYTDCPYLNEDKRSIYWQSSAITQKRVDEALKDPEKKGQVDRNLARKARMAAKSKDNPQETTNEDAKKDVKADENVTGAFCSQIPHVLRSSWVMDHGSGVHIANNTMKQRFIKERGSDGSTVMSGNGPLPIKAYGTMTIKVDTPTGKSSMILLNVAYVPDFLVNIVAGSILADKGLHFDTQHRHLHRNGSAIVLVPRIGAHYVLEDNREPKGVFATSIRAGSTHQLLVHANNEVIQHSATAAEGVKLPTSKAAPKAAPTQKAASKAASATTPKAASKAAPTSKAAPKAALTSKAATPLTPPTTPPKTWAAVAFKPAFKSASKPASTASPLQAPLTPPNTPPPTPAQTLPQPLKPYLTVDDLYRKFHVKKPLHQTRITAYFKPMIKPVRKNQGNTLSATKTQALSLASPATLKREIATFRSRKPMNWSFQKICFRFATKNRSRETLWEHPTYRTAYTKNISSYTPQSVWQNIKRGPQLEEVESIN